MPLILPPSVQRVRDEAQGKVLLCACCGAKFGIDQFGPFERHARQCSDRHSGQMEETVAKHRKTVFARAADQERYEHFRKGGKS